MNWLKATAIVLGGILVLSTGVRAQDDLDFDSLLDDLADEPGAEAPAEVAEEGLEDLDALMNEVDELTNGHDELLDAPEPEAPADGFGMGHWLGRRLAGGEPSWRIASEGRSRKKRLDSR